MRCFFLILFVHLSVFRIALALILNLTSVNEGSELKSNK